MNSIGAKRPLVEKKVIWGWQRLAERCFNLPQLRGAWRKLRLDGRVRSWDPVLTLVACIVHQMKQGCASRSIEDLLQYCECLSQAARRGSAFCAARQRLPLELFEMALGQSAQAASSAQRIFCGWCVSYVDGTTLPLANSPQNAKHFGRSQNQKGESRSPLARLLLYVCAGSGAVLRLECGPYAKTEQDLFAALLKRTPRGTLLVGDRLFSAFWMLGAVAEVGCALLTRYSTSRTRYVERSQLGRGEWIEYWQRSPRVRPEFQQPCELAVRVVERVVERKGYRSWVLKLATTLLEPQTYSGDALAEEYLRRWAIEGDLRTLKADFSMNRLSARQPDSVVREIYSVALALNMLRVLAVESGASPRRISCAQARLLVAEAAAELTDASPRQRKEIFTRLYTHLSHKIIHSKPRPPEPRAIIQHKSKYPVLTITRTKWKRKNAS